MNQTFGTINLSDQYSYSASGTPEARVFAKPLPKRSTPGWRVVPLVVPIEIQVGDCSMRAVHAVFDNDGYLVAVIDEFAGLEIEDYSPQKCAEVSKNKIKKAKRKPAKKVKKPARKTKKGRK